MRAVAAGTHEVIRIDAAWIAVEPLDMRAGVDTALARVVKVFGEARSHHAYLFLNRRANRLKVFVHDGFGRSRLDEVTKDSSAGLKYRPPDFSAPLAFVRGVLGPHEIVLAQRPLDR